VLVACAELGRYLASKGAEVRFILLDDGPNGEKVGLDDAIAAGKTVRELKTGAVPLDELPCLPAADAELEDDYSDVPDESGAELLDDLVAFFGRFLVLGESHRRILALFSLHTHALDAFCVTPRLNITSAEKRSGKSRVVECLQCTCARPEPTLLPSAASIFRLTEETTPTWLLDEFDNTLSAGEEAKAALLAVINGGYRRGASVPRVEKQGERYVTVRYRIFAPVVMSGIGQLPDATADRCITIPMVRKLPAERTERLHAVRTFDETETLRRREAAWAVRHLEALSVAEPKLPDGLDDRAAEVWEPLLAIADEAGGDWPAKARAAASGSAEERLHSDSPQTGLLADLRTLWDELGWGDYAPSSVIIPALWRMEPDDRSADWQSFQWGRPLDATKLARLLRPYGVTPGKSPRDGSRTQSRGYAKADLEPVWARYLPARDTSSEPVSPVSGVSPEQNPCQDVCPPETGGTGETAISGGGDEKGVALDHDPHGVGRGADGMVRF
jgi:hypothetical protein